MEIISFLRGVLIWCYLKWGDVFLAFCTKLILSSFSTGFLGLLSEGEQDELKHGGAVSWVCITVTDRLHLTVTCCISHCRSHTHAENVRTRTHKRRIDHSHSLAWKAIHFIADWQARHRFFLQRENQWCEHRLILQSVQSFLSAER